MGLLQLSNFQHFIAWYVSSHLRNNVQLISICSDVGMWLTIFNSVLFSVYACPRYSQYMQLSEYIVAAILLLNSVYHFGRYIWTTFSIEPLTVTPHQQKLLGVKETGRLYVCIHGVREWSHAMPDFRPSVYHGFWADSPLHFKAWFFPNYKYRLKSVNHFLFFSSPCRPLCQVKVHALSNSKKESKYCTGSHYTFEYDCPELDVEFCPFSIWLKWQYVLTLCVLLMSIMCCLVPISLHSMSFIFVI